MLILVRIADFFSSFQHTQTLESNEETFIFRMTRNYIDSNCD